jgi:hypothetical protein
VQPVPEYNSGVYSLELAERKMVRQPGPFHEAKELKEESEIKEPRLREAGGDGRLFP